ncbi:hypothetical protein D3OALGA1CA_3845 [Olavius algarvensis associated proteobacterium Delta 3]|nr:hypothetical protein D3OALGA1CA_3845 [Olavius algarvensis associated proteobacterium Delta 3]
MSPNPYTCFWGRSIQAKSQHADLKKLAQELIIVLFLPIFMV